MVVAGSAWVEPLAQCTELTTLHVRKKGAEQGRETNTANVSSHHPSAHIPTCPLFLALGIKIAFILQTEAKN